jgi:hypothetical protein
MLQAVNQLAQDAPEAKAFDHPGRGKGWLLSQDSDT